MKGAYVHRAVGCAQLHENEPCFLFKHLIWYPCCLHVHIEPSDYWNACRYMCSVKILNICPKCMDNIPPLQFNITDKNREQITYYPPIYMNTLIKPQSE